MRISHDQNKGTRVTLWYVVTMSKPRQSSILNFIVPNPPVAATPEVTPTHPEQDSPTELESDRGNEPRTIHYQGGSQTLPVSESDRCLVSFEPVASMSNDEIPEKFHPPSTYKFPKRKFGSTIVTEWSFQSHWCDTYKWLHYDKATDAAFCHVCMRAQKEKSF